MRSISAAAPMAPDPTVTLNFFDEAIYEATFLRLEQIPDLYAEAWSGVVDGQYGPGTVIFLVDPMDGRVLGNVRVDGRLFRVHSDMPTGRYHLAEINSESLPEGVEEECALAVVEPPIDDPIDPIDPIDLPPSPIHEIDVRLLHADEMTVGWMWGWPAAAALLETNVTFELQGNRARFRVHSSPPASHSGSGDLVNDLDWLKASPGATTLRGTADLVVLVVEEGGDYCGLADLGTGEPMPDQRFASVVVQACALNNFTLAHELGHNLAACHDPDVGNCLSDFANDRHGYIATWGTLPTTCPPGVPEEGCIEWRGVRSIMAYSNYCIDQGINCPRVPLFSDPSTNWIGDELFPGGPRQVVPFGHLFLSNNNRVIDETSEFVRGYR